MPGTPLCALATITHITNLEIGSVQHCVSCNTVPLFVHWSYRQMSPWMGPLVTRIIPTLMRCERRGALCFDIPDHLLGFCYLLSWPQLQLYSCIKVVNKVWFGKSRGVRAGHVLACLKVLAPWVHLSKQHSFMHSKLRRLPKLNWT